IPRPIFTSFLPSLEYFLLSSKVTTFSPISPYRTTCLQYQTVIVINDQREGDAHEVISMYDEMVAKTEELKEEVKELKAMIDYLEVQVQCLLLDRVYGL
ncbi:hypothetical protein LINPERHAP1_LOCUS21133, partial [Linum perenne]